jgi:hypothetical protein
VRSDPVLGADAEARCQPGERSTFPVRLFGRAFGPFPGRFKERGTIVVGRHDRVMTNRWGVESTAGPVLSWRARFRIVSGDTLVSGRLWLNPHRRALSEGECGSFVDQPVVINDQGWRLTGWDVSISARLRYRATISGPDGEQIVRGRAYGEAGVGFAVTTLCPLPPPQSCSGYSSFLGGGSNFH